MEVWGAQGGESNGGRGGYSLGYKSIEKTDILYVCVGHQGKSHNVNIGGEGGYNGGGRGGDAYSANFAGAAGGGGATHIAITTNRGVLKNYVNNKSEILIVAGGGAGSACGWSAPSGGGTSGGSFVIDVKDKLYMVINGGTQNSGYAFGQGQAGRNGTNSGIGSCEGAGGSGGGYYGGYAQTSTGAYTNSNGTGGSGYIGGVTYGTTISGVRSGDGYAVISWHPDV